MKRMFKHILLAVLTIIALGSSATAQYDIEPAGWPQHRPVCPPIIIPPKCPPSFIIPTPLPSPAPAPDTATTPTEPSISPPFDSIPPAPTPETPAPTIPTGTNLLAEAPGLGTGAGRGSLLPNVNGDLLGGGGIAGPLPVIIAPTGQPVGAIPIIVLPDGRRVPIFIDPQLPTDELIRGRGILTEAPPGSQLVGVFPPDGAVFAPEFANLVSRLPQIVRGPFKVTENESPQPRTRAYFSYYFYDQVFRNFGGPAVPRVMVHQQVFGYEQAFWDQRASLGIRLPYNQLVSTSRFYSDTALGDITIVSKFVIAEDGTTGSLMSGGLVVTPPTAGRPFESTITGDRIGGTLLQPYLGFIRRRDRAYLQGFTSLVVPTDSRDVTLLTNDYQIGYIAYENPGALLSSIVPTAELHVNTPLNKRGARRDPVGFVDQVTLLGGTQFMIRDRSGIGIAAGAPITGPRPFSLQVTVQFNLWF
jgi:hypothetical protein